MFPNAALLGANTVKVPSPLRVSTSPAAFTAVTRVDKLFVAIAAPAIVGKSLSPEAYPLELKKTVSDTI